jgi:L-lactate dehydrogenase complex protein LldG
MSSRENILGAIQKNQPPLIPIPEVNVSVGSYGDPKEKFSSVLTGIGGSVINVTSLAEVSAFVKTTFQRGKRVVSCIPGLDVDQSAISPDPHQLENVELAIIKGEFGVAENGAIWITDDVMGDRALPLISQHLAIVVNKTDIVQTLHEAYSRIGLAGYNLGMFIAGPSKTADIEQSLVLGAHGARSLTVFLIG